MVCLALLKLLVAGAADEAGLRYLRGRGGDRADARRLLGEGRPGSEFGYHGCRMAGDWYSDTDPRALKVFIEAQRRLSPGEKIAAVLEMSEFLMRLAEDNVRTLHPEFSEREVFLSAASRRLDRQTMLRVYGWDPEAARP